MSLEHFQDEANLKTLRELRARIERIARERKASNIRVFGSFAKDTVDENSDIDFLVNMAPDATLVDLIRLEHDLEEFLGREVDVLTEGAVHPSLQEEVRSTAIRL